MKRQIYKRVTALPEKATSGYFSFIFNKRYDDMYLYDICSSMTGEYIFTIPLMDYIEYSPRFAADFTLLDQADLSRIRTLFPITRRGLIWRAETWEELFSYFDRFLDVEAYKDLGYYYDEGSPFED